ncbi:MAG: adenylosuccinate lyase [Bacteroidales bacterium]|nr:adenylosuccinate lyase [Bacteroidales bacterium]
MELNALTAVSPVDGRYHDKTEKLSAYFSEYALIKYRLKVEVEYFIALCEIPLKQLQGVDKTCFAVLREMAASFSEADAARVKEIERITNHDVKAVEYFLKERFDAAGLSAFKEFIHFGLTSQDINNTSVPWSFKDAVQQTYLPALGEVVSWLRQAAETWKDIPMLAHTHGQPASPTRLGKEIGVFVERLDKQIGTLTALPFTAKFGGATGNFNAHHVAYPDIDWRAFGNRFVAERLGLVRDENTTQIEHYDFIAAQCDAIKRINVILIDLCRDIWTYISMEYFKQRIRQNEVGSSAMPHKVNPIDFENAEGNLGVANALLQHLAAKLPISRMQRDLTDSTVLRNIGVPLAHTMIALVSLIKGLNKLIVNETAIEQDLRRNWIVVSEGIQTILRREGYPKPYETLKALTRTNEAVTRETINQFIDTLDVSDAVKAELKDITPFNYTGM